MTTETDWQRLISECCHTAVSELGEGHETTHGPAGISDYCNGTCQARRTI